MTLEEATGAQNFILNLIGFHLERIAVHEMMIQENHFPEEQIGYIEHFKEWNNELEELYKKNSLYIRKGELNKVKMSERKEPPKF